MAIAALEITWSTFLLRDIGISLSTPPMLLYLTTKLAFHARSKHIELDYHFLREKVADGSLIMIFVPGTQQLAYICTKGQPRCLFSTICAKLAYMIIPMFAWGKS